MATANASQAALDIGTAEALVTSNKASLDTAATTYRANPSQANKDALVAADLTYRNSLLRVRGLQMQASGETTQAAASIPVYRTTRGPKR